MFLRGAASEHAAETACAEAGIGLETQKVIDEANKAASPGEMASRLPFLCMPGATIFSVLRRLESDWVKKRLSETYHACYFDLGVSILANSKPRLCKVSHSRFVYKAYTYYGLAGKNVALDEQYARYNELDKCE